MWVVAWVALASGSPCTWSATGQAVGTRDMIVGEAKARLQPWSNDLDLQVDTELIVGDPLTLRATLTSPEVVLFATFDLGEVHPMTLVGDPIRYGTYGTVPASAAVHIVGAQDGAVDVVPSSVHLGEVHIEDAMRQVPCESLGLRPAIRASVTGPHQEADETTTFNMHRGFELRHEPKGDEVTKFTPKHGPMHVTRVGEEAGRSRFEYRDRFGAVWTRWNTVSTMNAYNRPALLSGLGGIGTGGMGMAPATHRCERRVPIRNGDGVEIGYVRAGAAITTRETRDGVVVGVPWVWMRSKMVLESLEGCEAV